MIDTMAQSYLQPCYVGVKMKLRPQGIHVWQKALALKMNLLRADERSDGKS